MSQSSVPVDLYNPGQVFGCIGLTELADRLLGGARGSFDWGGPGPVRFRLHADGDEDPVRAALEFLDGAAVVALAPEGSENRTEKWQVPTLILGDESPFPTPDTAGPPQLPARLWRGGVGVDVCAWADSPSTNGRDAVKFWAGAGGYPGAAFLRDALIATGGRAVAAAADPFSLSAPLGSNLRFDWRGGYVPLDTGFSLNAHAGMSSVGYPLVELLAAVGMAHARPQRMNRLAYRYAVTSGEGEEATHGLPLPLLRLALGAVCLPLPTRTFIMRLGWAGQEGQARTITSVTEESLP